MSEIPLEQAPGQVTDAAHEAARGQVVYLTEHGERLADAYAIAKRELVQAAQPVPGADHRLSQ